MKNIGLLLSTTLWLLTACDSGTQKLQKQVDSLQHQLSSVYKPGFGEFMAGIQVHHAKLWFAGLNENWQLADFEIGEIEEALAGIQTFCKDRPESKSIPMITPPMEHLKKAIEEKNLLQFKQNYDALTMTCNNCHRSTNHDYNVITTPSSPPFSNQEFKLHLPVKYR